MTEHYVTILFKSNDSSYSYNKHIKIPCGAVITGNTVQYKVDEKGQLFENGKLVSDNTIKLTKAQLAAVDTFANIDGNGSDITPDELRNGGGWGISYYVSKALQKVGSCFKLDDPLYGANSGETACASADFVRDFTPEEENIAYNSKEDYDKMEKTRHSRIIVDLEKCE